MSRGGGATIRRPSTSLRANGARLLLVAAVLSAKLALAEELTFTTDEADSVPSVLAGPFAPLPSLPGTSTLLSPVALPSVRGQQPSATAYLYDGVRLPTLFHLTAGPPIIPLGAMSGFSFNRSIAPARTRGASGGVVSVNPRDDLESGLHNVTQLDLLNVNTTATWVSKSGGTSVIAGAGLLWTPMLYTRAFTRSLRADMVSYTGRFEHRIGDGSVRLLAIGMADAFRSRSSTDLLAGGMGMHRVDGRIRQPLAGGEFELGLTAGVDTVSAELGGAVSRTNAFADVTTLATRVSWSGKLYDMADVSFGLDGERRNGELEQSSRTLQPPIEGGDDSGPIESRTENDIGAVSILGAWADVGIGDPDWRGTIGARIDSYDLGPAPAFVAVDPRVSMRRRLRDNLVLTVAAAMTHLPPTHLIPLPPADLAGIRFGLQEIIQTNAELTYRARADAELTVSAFVNPVNRAVEMSPLDRNFLQTVKAPPGSTYAPDETAGLDMGAELMLRRIYSGDYFGWVSYSFLRSRRTVRVTTRNDFGEPEGSRTAEIQPAWSQAHVSNLVLGRTWGRWTFSAALQLRSGSPEAGGLSSFTQRAGEDRLRAGPRWIEQDRDRVDTLPPFVRADVHIARDFVIGPVALQATLDIQNITFAREVTRYSYTEAYDSLEDRAAGNIRLVRTPGGSPVPALPLPMLGVKARY